LAAAASRLAPRPGLLPIHGEKGLASGPVVADAASPKAVAFGAIGLQNRSSTTIRPKTRS
jgi:hypothetical protein